MKPNSNSIHVPPYPDSLFVLFILGCCRSISAVLVLAGFACRCASQSFTWPVDIHPVGQPYAAYNSGSPNKYHTGMDIGDGNYNYTTTVKAVHAGTVHKIFGIYGLPTATSVRRWNSSTDAYTWDAQPTTDRLGQSYSTDNHGLGICVIIYHADLQLYTLYGHLDAVVAGLAPGQSVPVGSEIGRMGNSYKFGGVGYLRFSPPGESLATPQGSPPPGYAWSDLIKNDPSGFRPHVHLEAKDRGVLSAGRSDTPASPSEQYWGYTPGPAPGTTEKPGHPNFWGYHNPNVFLNETVTKLAQPVPVEVLGALHVRDYPSTSGSISRVITEIAARGDGRLPAFVATRGVDGWYQVSLPSGLTEGWSASGWIAGNLLGTIYSRQNNDLTQVKVTDESARVYTSQNTASPTLAFVYGQNLLEEQRFVPFESPSGWHHIYTPQKVTQADAWLLSSAVVVIGGRTLPEIRVQVGLNNLVDGQAVAVDFGSVVRGQNASTISFTVWNDGGETLTLGTPSLPVGYTLIEPLSASLPAGGNDTFTVQLDTATVGTKSGQISFINNDGDENPFNFPITGVVSELPPEIRVQVGLNNIADGQASPIDFGSVAQGLSGPEITFTVWNDGGQTLTLGTPTFPGGYTLTEPLGASLAPGAFDSFTVRLDSGTLGVKSGQVSFSNNDSDENPFDFPITGQVTAAPPEIRVQVGLNNIADGQASPIDFGSVAQGVSGPEITFTVWNDGNQMLTLGVPSLPSGYTLTEPLTSSLSGGTFDTFTVRLDSAVLGPKTGSIVFSNDDIDESPFNFPITGTVTAPPATPVLTNYTFITLAGLAPNIGSDDGAGTNARFFAPFDVAVDAAGNAYVADKNNHVIRKISTAGIVTTLAGHAGSSGSANGSLTAARFFWPSGVAVDTAGNVYVADTANHTIRKLAGGTASTLAGQAGSFGSADGTGGTARFFEPSSLTVDSLGNIFVSDTGNHTIRKVTAAGVVTTFAGLAGSFGSDDGMGTAARFRSPHGLAMDGSGNVIVADFLNCTIRKITPSRQVSTLAGVAGSSGSADGTWDVARFGQPWGVARDNDGNLFVADNGLSCVRMIGTDGIVRTIGGTAFQVGATDGPGRNARFYELRGLAIDAAGDLYIADTANSTIRKGVLTPTLAIARSGGNLVLSWPTNTVGFALEYTTKLPGTSWQAAAPAPVTVGNQYVVTNSAMGASKFYRLKK